MNPLSNPARILTLLDRHLHHRFRLYIYGRSAIALGYSESPGEMHATLDVAAILPASEVGAIESNDDFWTAQEKVNEELGESGLYFTHLFEDRQVILTPNWQSKTVKIRGLELQWLEVWRPSTIDLVLTKMMRVDPEDRADIEFLVRQNDFDAEEMLTAFDDANVPPVPEIQDAFSKNQQWLRTLLEDDSV